MSKDLWRFGVKAKDQRPDGTIRHSQIVSTFGPGALLDLVDDAAVVAGLSWWARGPQIVEDRLVAMLTRAPEMNFDGVVLFAPPEASKDLDDPQRKWIKAFRFPEWFVCQNEHCWRDAGNAERRDGGAPRRLLRINQLDGTGHKCQGGRGKSAKVQPTRFARACKRGHLDDVDWVAFAHRHAAPCRRSVLWVEEAGATGDLSDVRVQCSACGAGVRMSIAAQKFVDGTPPLGYCSGRRPWIGAEDREGCDAPARLLIRSASHAYFPVTASVIHIPDPDAEVRNKVESVYREHLDGVEGEDDVGWLRKKNKTVRTALEGITDPQAFAEVVRRRAGQAVPYKKVKEAEAEVLMRTPEAPGDPRPNGRFSARALKLPEKRRGVTASIAKVVLVHRLTEVRALAGFTRFEPKSADVDGEFELEIGAEIARLDEPVTWLPAVENAGEGVFLALKESALDAWERLPAVQQRHDQFEKGFGLWKGQRPDRQKAKPDFATARFVMLHSLSHLLITAVSLECGYAASAVRERIYVGPERSGILLYTSATGSEGSLGGLVEVGRQLERYLTSALALGSLCANDPVCAAHAPDHEEGGGDRYLEGASCHGCLLISEPSCERMNVYLDRTLVVPTVERVDAAFFEGR